MNRNIALLILGIFGIIAVAIAAGAYKYKFKATHTINVTGNALKDFDSDLVKWRATFSRSDFNLKTASDQLSADQKKVSDFLISEGISEKEIVFESVTIQKDYAGSYDAHGNYINHFNGYILKQDVTVESKDLDLIEKASREISSLIGQGIELSSSAPNYYYSKLEDLKLELISKASENARLRAENIAKESNSQLGELIKGDLGVFQITGQNDNDNFSAGGVFNTTARKKTANITVRLNFRVE